MIHTLLVMYFLICLRYLCLADYWSKYGVPKFIIYYFITGLGAALVQMLVVGMRIYAVKSGLSIDAISDVIAQGGQLLEQNMNYTDAAKGSLNILLNTGTIGASGAVFGILLAFWHALPQYTSLYYTISVPYQSQVVSNWIWGS